MKKTITLIASLLLALLFIYASYYKLKDYPLFVNQLSASPITSGHQNFLAWFIPSIEIITVGLLIVPRTRLIGLCSSFIIMLAFTLYVYVLPHFYPHPGCSCGGIISKFSWKGHFYFNLAFLLLAGTALSLFPQRKLIQK